MLNVTEIREEIHVHSRLVVGVDVSKETLDAYAKHIRSEGSGAEFSGWSQKRLSTMARATRH